MHIIHIESTAQIKGFQDLFIHLNTNPDANDLRRLIYDYFVNSPPLCAHLRSDNVPPQVSCGTGNLDSTPPPFPGRSQPDFLVCISIVQQAHRLAADVCSSRLNGKLNVRCTPPVTGVWKKSTVFLVLPLGLTHRRRICVFRTPASRSVTRFNHAWPRGALRSYGYEALRGQVSQP